MAQCAVVTRGITYAHAPYDARRQRRGERSGSAQEEQKAMAKMRESGGGIARDVVTLPS